MPGRSAGRAARNSDPVSPLPPDAPGAPWPRRLARAAFFLGPLVAWVGVLWALGAQYGSFTASHRLFTGALDRWVGTYLRPDETYLMAVTIQLRRLAAVACYAVLALLLVRALQWGRGRLLWYSPVGAAILGLVAALADSWHKSRVPGRHGGAGDVLLALWGVGLALSGVLLFFGAKALERRLLSSAPGTAPEDSKNGQAGLQPTP